MNPLFVSTGCIIITEILAGLVRKFVEAAFKDNFFKQLVFEAIATAELCATCFELIIGKYFIILYFYYRVLFPKYFLIPGYLRHNCKENIVIVSIR